jgi:hypothetical protein
MTLKIGDRIKIQEFVDLLSTLSFDEVTFENMLKVFPNSQDREVTEVDDGIKDVEIDDYVFTISRKSPNEVCLSDYNINDTIVLDKEVVVWLPNNSKGGTDIDGHGTIIQDYYNNKKVFAIKVDYTIQ